MCHTLNNNSSTTETKWDCKPEEVSSPYTSAYYSASWLIYYTLYFSCCSVNLKWGGAGWLPGNNLTFESLPLSFLLFQMKTKMRCLFLFTFPFFAFDSWDLVLKWYNLKAGRAKMPLQVLIIRKIKKLPPSKCNRLVLCCLYELWSATPLRIRKPLNIRRICITIPSYRQDQ